MKYTNRLNLPDVFERILTSSQYASTPNRFGVTTILKPAQEIVLSRRYEDEIVEDVSDMVNMLFGTAVHDLLEKHNDGTYVEKKFEYLDTDTGYVVVGKIDYYDEVDFRIIDYKTAKVSKIQYADYKDWKLQGLMYAWLLMKNGLLVDSVTFYALLKDWTSISRDLNTQRGTYYPEAPIYEYSLKVRPEDLTEMEEYVTIKLKEIASLEKMDTAEILEVPIREERWKPEVKYAVRKIGNTKATKIFESRSDAETLKETGDYVIEERVGFDPCAHFCSGIKYAKKLKEY